MTTQTYVSGIRRPIEAIGIPLYGGEVLLAFDPVLHRYEVKDYGRIFEVPSVTTILGVVDKSGPLTQWAANQAAERVRQIVKPGDVLDEIRIEEIANDIRFNFRKISARAKSVGALAHHWIEAHLLRLLKDLNAERPELPVNEQARNACRAALHWMARNQFVPLTAEAKLYSRRYGYAGTMDFPARVNGNLAVLDWKTSAAIYPEYQLQVAAYTEAYEEMLFAGEGCEPVAESWIIRLGKDDGEFEAVRIPREEQAADFRAFLAAMRLYQRIQAIRQEEKKA